MLTSPQAIINRARVYIDDDHNETPGWLSETTWLDLFNTEYAEQYRVWVRSGLISPTYVDVPFSNDSDVELPVDPETQAGVLSIVEVVEDTGQGYRVIPPAQSVFGRRPFRYSNDPETRKAQCWEAQGNGFGDNLVVILQPGDSTGNYIVRYIPQVTRVVAEEITAESYFPDGLDERIALGIARRAKLKEGTASALLERLIAQSDADTRMIAFGRFNGDSPRVRVNRGYFPRQGLSFASCPDRYGV